MILYGIVGWKNAGKTTLVERLVAEMVGRGLRVSTLKHTHHGVDLDQPGKDTHRHRQAGAHQVLLASGARWALLTELRGAVEPPLTELAARLDPVDLVLVEGWKQGGHPKIEVWRAATGHPLIAPGDPTVRAVATPDACAVPVPCLDLDDIAGIADFILTDAGLR